MPEGDTVYRAAARLRGVLEGQVLTSTEFRVPCYATVDLSGRRLDAIETHGKHLVFWIGDVGIWTHLMMEGRWRTYRPGARWDAPAHAARCVLTTKTVQVVGFDLGFVRVLPRDEVVARLAHLGPDPLRDDWDASLAHHNLTAQGDRDLGLALLDQSLIAGLGNVYRSEVCFLARLHPRAPVSTLTSGDIDSVVRLAERLLVLNKDRAARNTTGNAGGSPLWVYGRARRPCLRCRTRIVHEHLGDPRLLRGTVGGDSLEPVERDLYWCPTCQPDLT